MNVDGIELRLPRLSYAALRKVLARVLLMDADLDAFCLDYFREVYDRFTIGMDRVQKINLLMGINNIELIWRKLEDRTGDNHEKLKELRRWLFEAEAGSEDSLRIQAVNDEIDRLSLDRHRDQNAGIPTIEIDNKLVALKRTLRRQRQQLGQGETLVGRYRLDTLLGQGGFAKVWLAFDRFLKQPVAVKVLHSDHGENSQSIDRFKRGARQMSTLVHAHIVRVVGGPHYDAGFHFFVMEYMSQGDLDKAVCGGTLSPNLALDYLAKIGEALQHAHARGVTLRSPWLRL